MRLNGTFSYYFAGTKGIRGNYFQVRSTEYGRYLKEQQQNNAIHQKNSKRTGGK